MKQRVKHLLSALLVLCIILIYTSVPTWAANADSEGTENAPWDISDDAGNGSVKAWFLGSGSEGYTLYIAGEGRMTETFRTIDPPWKSIKNHITSVVIGEGVENVGAYAFNFCRALTHVTLPESLTEIGTYAFHSTGVKRLVIPAAVDRIGRMIANPTTYFEVLGNPSTVDNHAFSTSLVSVTDQAVAEALNPKTDVLAIIVLNGGVYGETDLELENLSYGLIAPKLEGAAFEGWYQSADFSGQRCAQDERGRTAVNINHIYYAKWGEEVPILTPTPTPDTEPSGTITPTPEVTPSVEPTGSATPTPDIKPTGSITPVPEPTSVPKPTGADPMPPKNTPVPEPTKPAEISPVTGIPNIKGELDKRGWETIKEEIQRTKEGSTVVVQMNGLSIVQGSVIDTIKERNITVVFEMGDQITWSISGTSITDTRAGDIDLRVEINTDHIPDNLVQDVSEEGDATQLTLFHNGEFGFTAWLSINMGENNVGRDAVLYYYNGEIGKLERHGEDRVGSEGYITFPFTHASDYVIVLSKSVEPEKETTPTPKVTPIPEPTKEAVPTVEVTPIPEPTGEAVPTTGANQRPEPTGEAVPTMGTNQDPEPTKAVSTPAITPSLEVDTTDTGLQPTGAPQNSATPTPEVTLTPETTPTENPEPTKGLEATEEPPIDTKQPDTPTDAPQSPTQSASASSTPQTKTDAGFNWMIPIGIVVAAGVAALCVVVLVRRKSGGKK
ncbi:MAG: leucine-rich repeat protein [Lachnospiraceae bacterium]|nr:leucine-rich repeat protein [Lachnospiraceae bacterium]